MPEKEITAREQLKINIQRAEELDKQADELRRSADSISIESADLISRLIEEEKMLDGTSWEMILNKKSVYLEFQGNFKSPEMQKIFEITDNRYYSSFVLGDGIDLYYDDHKISIHLNDLKLVAPFVKKMGIILDTSRIRDDLHRMRRELVALEIICHQLQLMV